MGIDFQQLAKILTELESKPSNKALVDELARKKRGVPIVGITGLPGAGKSTLIDQLIAHFRSLNQTVGVVAVDPSSPLTGGALLGDRVRMQRHATDPGVFIRSLGSRGAHGGLSAATRDFCLALDAFGFDRIIVETVGVGQTEVDIMHLATTTVVVLTPEAGDSVQSMKAGLLEIADILVVNKMDRLGAEEMRTMLQSATDKPVLLTEAFKGIGVKELWEEITKNSRK